MTHKSPEANRNSAKAGPAAAPSGTSELLSVESPGRESTGLPGADEEPNSVDKRNTRFLEGAASMLCCYNLPDYRLEHPDLAIRPVAAENKREAPAAAPGPAPKSTPENP